MLLWGATYWNDGWTTSEWLSLFSSIVSLIGIGLAAWLAHRYNQRQAQTAHEHNQQQAKSAYLTTVRADRLRREIKALEDVWTLLAYMSDQKSDKAIIHWLHQRKTGEDKQYFFHFDHLQQFCLHEVSTMFYQRHAGLFISNEIRDLVFAYRRIAMGFYMEHYQDKELPENRLILIKNAEQAKKLKDMYDKLNTRLRQEMEARYAALAE